MGVASPPGPFASPNDGPIAASGPVSPLAVLEAGQEVWLD